MNYRYQIICCILAILSFRSSTASAQKSIKTEKIDCYLREMLSKNNVPGFAIAIVTKDSVLFSKGYGANSKRGVVTSKSPFAIASLSKAFTAMAVMQLAAAGKLNIDAPVTKYISTFKLYDPSSGRITVRQLLNQTSGLNDVVFPELAFKDQPENLDEAIDRLQDVALGSDPGTRFRYHNPNYQVLAKIVEAVSQKPFPSYLEANIFAPLQMSGTKAVSSTNELNRTFNAFSNGHIFAFGKPIPIREPDWFVAGAAGMVSNVDDMAKWLRLQLNNGESGNLTLLDSISLKEMHTSPGQMPYGMGWFTGKNGTISHSGILWTYSAEQIITRDGYGMVMLFNGGINAFEDYHAFIQGVTDILENREPEVPAISGWMYALVVNAVLLIGISFALRRLFRQKYWYLNYLTRPHWRSWVFLFMRSLPAILLVSLPYLVTAISGRVLNWKRIFLMMPDVLALFGIIAVLNLILIANRLTYLKNRQFLSAKPSKPD